MGTTCLITEFGGLVATGDTALLNPPLPERVKKVEVTLEGGIKWSDKLTLPYEPFIGTIGTSPEIEAITSLQPDYYGGNMDLPDVGVDAVIYLPVNAPARYLSRRLPRDTGDGELCGVALEHPTVTTLQVDLIKKWTSNGRGWKTQVLHDDRLEPADGGRRTNCLSRTVRWMAADFGSKTRRVHASYPMRSRAPWQHGGPKIHARCVYSETLSHLNFNQRVIRPLCYDTETCGVRSNVASIRTGLRE